ncbi:MAG: HNH endonuclease [Clostridia bacterium]|nr:HNH endonuclease [Clostridia bacterium]
MLMSNFIYVIDGVKYIDKKKFYNSIIWKHKRACILKRDGNMCQHCKWYGKRTDADTVHHIKHLEDFPELGLEDSNLISLCNSCHNKEHPEKRRKKILITLVSGYPGSGKTTYVLEHKKYNDVMLDLDILYKALTNNNMYEEHKEKNIVEYINDLMRATIYKAKEYKFDVWFIRCMPNDIEVEILKENNARCIQMNVDRIECKKRLIKDKRLTKDFEFICNKIDEERKRVWNNTPPSFNF